MCEREQGRKWGKLRGGGNIQKGRAQSLKLPLPGIDRPIMWSSIYKNVAITANFMETFFPLLPNPPPNCTQPSSSFFVWRFNRILIDRSRFDWAATELCNGCTKPRSGCIDREELRQPVVHSISPPFIFRMATISMLNLSPAHLNKISRNTHATQNMLQYNLVQGLSCSS